MTPCYTRHETAPGVHADIPHEHENGPEQMEDEMNQLLASALRMAALEVEDAIAAGDVAEVAAPVDGESGRAEAVAARDEIYNDPAGWLRDRADEIEAEAAK